MAYANRADFESWGLPPALCAYIDTLDAGAIARALDDTSAEMDTHLRVVLVLPLTGTIDPTLRKWNCELAAPALLAWVGGNPEAPSADLLVTRAAAATAGLKRVAAKQQVLAATEGGPPVDGAVVRSQPARGWDAPCIRTTRGW